MSNYTKTTNFGAKDTLPSGDSQKIIRGTEFDTEFNNVATAIATKLEVDGSNNLAISGTFSSTKLIPTGGTATGNGMYLPAANTVALSTNGTERVRVDSSGNLGVGTTSPGSRLDVQSASSANAYRVANIYNSAATGTTAGSNVLLRVASNGSGADSTLVLTDSTSTNGFICNNNGNLLFGNGLGFTERMRLDSSGNLGIGTASPAYSLDVNGAINASADIISQGNNARISLYRSDGINYFDWASGQSLYFSTQTSAGGGGRSTKMTLDSSGNLTVGNVKLETGAGFGGINTVGATPLIFYTNNTEKARITSGGQLCLGVTAANGSARFTVGGLTTGTSAADVFVGRTGTEADGVGLGASIQLQNNTNTTACIIQQYSNNLQFFNYTGAAWTERARIKSTGQFRFVPLSSDPSGAESGDVYYNSTSNKLKVYNGTSWVDLH